MYSVSWCHNIKMIHPAHRHLHGDGDEVGVSFNRSSLSFETSTEISFQFQKATVISVSKQQPTLVKCWKIASDMFFEKLVLVIYNNE